MRARLISAAVLALAISLTQPLVAAAATAGGGSYGSDHQASGSLLDDGSGAEVIAYDGPGEHASATGSHGHGNVACAFYFDDTGDPVDFSTIPAGDYGDGILIQRQCDDTATGEYVLADVFAYRPGQGSPIAADQLASMAEARLDLPLPHASTSPAADRDQLVAVPTWLWVDGWAPVSRSATAGAVTATVTATPESVDWDMGNGERVHCDGPGTAYDTTKPSTAQSSDCTYTYRRSSADQPGERYVVTSTVTWRVTWSATGAPGGGGLGTVTRSSTTRLRVAEAQALNEGTAH
jgi:hypothetical protein